MKKVVKLFLVVVLLLCIQGAVNTESAYSKMKTYKEGKTYTLTGKVQRINYEHPNGRHFIVYLLKLETGRCKIHISRTEELPLPAMRCRK